MVRMWMVPPNLLCQKHLSGEHVECHMIYGSVMRGRNLGRHITEAQIDLTALQERHDELAEEMLRRGYNHNSPLIVDSGHISQYPDKGEVRRMGNVLELMRRCKECRRRMRK